MYCGQSCSEAPGLAVNAEETHLQLSEEVKHGHAHHNDHKGSQRCDHVHSHHAAPLLEEDDGGGQNHGGEEDVVDGVDQQGVEGVQRLVQVIHLWGRTSGPTSCLPTHSIWVWNRAHLRYHGDDESQQQDPGERISKHGNIVQHWTGGIWYPTLPRMQLNNTQLVGRVFMLVMWPGGQLTLTGVDGDGEALHRGDGEGAEQRADADVDQDVGRAEPRTEVQHQDRTQDQHHRHVDQKTWQAHRPSPHPQVNQSAFKWNASSLCLKLGSGPK